jgi:ATP-binding cassette subfamily B protein
MMQPFATAASAETKDSALGASNLAGLDLASSAWPAVGPLLSKLVELSPALVSKMPVASNQQAQSLPAAAAQRGLDLRLVSGRDGEVGLVLAQAQPMVVVCDGLLLLVAKASRRWVQLVTPDGARVRVVLRLFADRLRISSETQAANLGSNATATDSAALLLALEPHLGAKTAPAVAALTRWQAQDDSFRITLGWVPQAAPANTRSMAKQLGSGLLGMAAVRLGFLLMWVLSWFGLSALLRQVDVQGGYSLWVLTLLSALILLPLGSWLQHRLALKVGVGVRQALLQRALSLRRGEMGQLGLGELIAQALETNSIDTKACIAGVVLLFSVFELVLACGLIGSSADGGSLLLLLLLIASTVGWLLYRVVVLHKLWYPAKLRITAVQTEEMVGQRTRKALLGRAEWFADQDALLANYHRLTAKLDRLLVCLDLIPKLWLLLAMGCLLLLVYQGQTPLLHSNNLLLLAAAVVAATAWQGFADVALPLLDVRQMLRDLPGPVGSQPNQHPPTVQIPPQGADIDLALQVSGLRFAYPDAKQPLVQDFNLQLEPGTRALLLGPSGGGKSTLGTLLSGRLQASGGSVLAGGLDQHVLGAAGWQAQVTYIPQAHTNHIVAETLAFNLLLGSHWPPSREALVRAEQVAKELGLAPLLDAMPAGMNQVVGDNGWRLSAGERARVFLARGLLQNPGLLIVDEVLAPLDPHTAHRVLDCMDQRARKLLLITHE